MQGGHHVAQKFSTTTWPLNWLSVIVRAESRTVKFGAAEPIRAGRVPLLQPDSASRTKTMTIEPEKRRIRRTPL